MKNVSIAEAWASYRKLAVPDTASDVQVSETQKAFYAGAAIVVMVAERIGEPDVSEETGVAIFERFSQEVKAFVALTGMKTGTQKH